MKKGIGLWVVLVALTIGASAQDQTPRVDQRQANQLLRIRQGLVNGDLTRTEAARLIAARRNVLRKECMAKADGRVMPAERLHLRRMQARLSRQIFRERHDRQSRIY